jgi:hypothetical protein
MSTSRIAIRWIALGLLTVNLLPAAEGPLDQLDDQLSFSTRDGNARARLSGTLDLEAYRYSQPAPGLIDSEEDKLLNPRLTLFLDAQLGTQLYGFVQARADRGFDPGEYGGDARVDEYALRLTPWEDGRLSIQLGKFATVVGNWVPRHGSWDSPFITAPLAYENLTGIWDGMAAPSSGTVLAWAHILPRPVADQPATDKDQSLRLPILWGPSYAKGVAVSGEWRRLTYAAEVKSAALSSRPSTWEDTEFFDGNSTISARVGYRPNPMWNVGFSTSNGPYLKESAASSIPPGRRFRDYRQVVLAQDVSFAWHHFQLWAEFFEARFEIPGVGNADTFSYYAEARYKFTPRLAGAVRWNQQSFSSFPHGSAGAMPWGSDVWRLDVAPTFRFSAHTQVKVQYSFQHNEISPRETQHLLALQFVVRF